MSQSSSNSAAIRNDQPQRAQRAPASDQLVQQRLVALMSSSGLPKLRNVDVFVERGIISIRAVVATAPQLQPLPQPAGADQTTERQAAGDTAIEVELPTKCTPRTQALTAPAGPHHAVFRSGSASTTSTRIGHSKPESTSGRRSETTQRRGMPIVLPEVTADRSIQPALNVTSPIIDKVDVEPESEDVLRRRILDSLRSSGVATLKNLQVNISGRTVRLSGAVHSAFERQLVLQLAKRECGDFEIQNAIGIVMPKVERTSVLGLMHDAWITYRTQAIAAAAILLAITAYAAPWPQPQPAHTYAVAPECVFEKEPMIGAVIALHPENWTLPEDAIPVGRVTPNGNVVFSTFGDKDGVPAGRYIVTARWSKMTVTKEGDTVTGPELMPAQYRDPATSPIRVDIDSDRPELPVLAFCK